MSSRYEFSLVAITHQLIDLSVFSPTELPNNPPVADVSS